MDDQQFCLKWNNHQSTLISVFDSMLQRNLLVDCTLAAEGRTVKAHKVVLSACSPYFENVLTDHFDKHPIVILKDVKYQELEAMMDYMYRGEVNVSQDQLGSLLKTAESLQIKGLSDSRKEDEPPKKREHPTITRDRTPDKQSAQSRIPLVETHDVETNNMSREGSQSPGPRKRKRLRRRPSQEDLDSKVLVLDNHDGTSNASSTLSNVNTTAVPTTSVPENDTSSRVSSISANASSKPVVRSSVPQVPVINESLEPHSEVMLEPKSEYVEDDTNDDNIEDLTVSLDDDDDDMDQSKPGPSHGDGSNQGFGSWHMDPSQDESFMSTQDPSGQRDAQAEDLSRYSSHWDNWTHHLALPMVLFREGGMKIKNVPRTTNQSPPIKEFTTKVIGDSSTPSGFECNACGRFYKLKSSLRNHQKWECGKEPQFSCPYCVYKAKQKMHIARHLERMHKVEVRPLQLIKNESNNEKNNATV